MSQLSRGDIVFSKMGRDQGRYYIVVDADEKFAFIVDGKLHKIQKPKKKKFRHLIDLGAKSAVIEEKIKNGEELTNPAIRKAVSEYEKNL